MSKMAPGRWPAGVLGSAMESSSCFSGVMPCRRSSLVVDIGEPLAVKTGCELKPMAMTLCRKGSAWSQSAEDALGYQVDVCMARSMNEVGLLMYASWSEPELSRTGVDG